MEEKPNQVHNFKNREEWQTAINKAPASVLIKTRSLGAGKSSSYLPIEYQQALQDVFFDEFDIIDEKYQVIFNEIICTVKCQGVPSYPGADFRIFTGSGSKPIQCNAGSVVEKFPKGKKTNALEYNLPAARTTALSKALETVGNIFGRNLGRAVEADYNMVQRMKEGRTKEIKKTKNKSKDK